MRFLIQRVSEASVEVDQKIIGQIQNGLLVFVGVSDRDTTEIANRMIEKLLKLRIFEDSAGKTNCSLVDIDGEILVVSQFTLYADCKKGNRPSFTDAGSAESANRLYEYILQQIASKGVTVQHGVFGAMMNVSLVNHGPFTVFLDSDQLFGQKSTVSTRI